MPVWILLAQVLAPLAIKLIDKFVPDMITRKRPNHYKRRLIERLGRKR